MDANASSSWGQTDPSISQCHAPYSSPMKSLRVRVAVIFILTNIITWYASLSAQNQDAIAASLQIVSKQSEAEHSLLKSGVGLVTTDGMWEDPKKKYEDEDIKILGFTDFMYLPLATLWYDRLTHLVSI